MRHEPLAILLAASLSAFAPVTSHAEEGPDADRFASILVLDLRTQGVDASVADILSEEIVVALRDAGVGQVLSASDVRDMLSLEAQRQLVGCDEGSCLAEIAGSLGAREVVTGVAARFGGAVMVRLRLLDTQEARLIEDATAESRSVDELRDLVRRATFEMVDAPYQPRRQREVAWPLNVVALGGSLLGPSTADTAWSFDVVYTHRAGSLALGPVFGLVRADTYVDWADFGATVREQVAVDAWRAGLAARWPDTGGTWVRPYLAGEVGLMRLQTRTADTPETWAVTAPRDLIGPYGAAAVGLRILPRARFGFAVELGLLMTGVDPAIRDRGEVFAGEVAPEAGESRGAVGGPFVKGVFRYGF